MPAASRLRSGLSGALMGLAWGAILASSLLQVPVHSVAVAAVLGYLALELTSTSRLTRVHLGAGVLLAGAVLTVSDTALQDLHTAAFRASFIMVLFASLGMLQSAVMRARAFVVAGEMLVRQPPGRQYFALAGGTTLFGAILNFGVLPLMGGLVKTALTQAPTTLDPAKRERRMMLAMLRGFSVLMFWCPLTLAYAITTISIQGLDWRLMSLAGMVMAVLTIALGRFFDRSPAAPAPEREGVRFDCAALAPVLVLLLALSLLAALIDTLTPGGLVHGVILFVPLTAIVLLARFEPDHGRARLAQYLGSEVATQRNEVAVLGNAAFSGALIATLLPQAMLLSWLGSALPVALIPPLCLWAVVLLGQAGLNPLISVAALASIFANPILIGIDPTLLGLAFVTGWGLAVGSSSAAAATMSIGRLAGRSAWEIGTGWNGRFTLTASLFVSALLMVLSLAIG